jgi:tetratricopeptide (TPR) repeat protein
MALARTHLQDLVGQFPDYGLAWFHLGLLYFRLGSAEAALFALSRFLQLGVGHLVIDQPEEKLILTALLTQAQALRRLGHLEDAGEVLQTAQQRYPQEYLVWLETAAWARAQSNVARARQALETCLQIRPDSRQAHQWLTELAG